MIPTTLTTPSRTRMTTWQLPSLHVGQIAAVRAFRRARVLVLYTGRQWGKSRLATALAIQEACEGGAVWWIAPSYPIASVGWRLLCRMLADATTGETPAATISLSDRRISFVGGGSIQVKSADNPDSLRGATLDLAILDEAAFMPERTWSEVIRPTLAVRGGRAVMATTPNGMDWVHDLFIAGQGPNDDGIVSLRFASADNPFMPAGEVERARAALPPAVFAQEWEAHPDSGGGGCIPLDWIRAAVDRWHERKSAGTLEDGELSLGVDVSEGGGDRTVFALRFGWTVARLEDHTPREIGAMMPIVDKVEAIIRKHGGRAIVDNVGVGALVPDMLRRRGVKVTGFKAGEGTKLRDSTGQFGFADLRTAAWWHMRELLSPETGPGLALPPDRELMADLAAPGVDVVAGARLKLESKDKLRPRLGRSPDKADAVVMACWTRGVMTGRILGGS